MPIPRNIFNFSSHLVEKLVVVAGFVFSTCNLSAQQLPTLEQLQQYDHLLNSLIRGEAENLSDRLFTNIENPLELASLLLINGNAAQVLEILENYEIDRNSTDPTLTYVFELRAEAWLLLGDEKKARVSQLSRLESLKLRLGYRHPVFQDEITKFVEQWKESPTINADELNALADWLRKPTEISLKAKSTEAPSLVPVWFGTNRQSLGRSDPSSIYGARLGKLEVGRLVVSIPKAHQRSTLERPALWQISNRVDPLKHIVLTEITKMDKSDFVDECCGEQDKLMFIHGYNVSFHDGALRAGQMAYDLEFPGAIHYYSWPSQASLWGYLSDANNVVPSRPYLIEYLDMITRSPGKLHIVAHSMGNRYLLEALEIFLRDFPDRSLGKVIFAAPDVDQTEFSVRLKSLEGRVGGLTLYGSRNDRALRLSRSVNGRPRAGDTGDALLKIAGLTSIDASGIANDSLGHSYFADTNEVLADIMGTIRLDWPATERCSLTPRDTSSWNINAKGCRLGSLIAVTRLLAEHTQANALAEAETNSQTELEAEGRRFWTEVLQILEQVTELTPDQ